MFTGVLGEKIVPIVHLERFLSLNKKNGHKKTVADALVCNGFIWMVSGTTTFRLLLQLNDLQKLILVQVYFPYSKLWW